jgi:aspartate/methionine/tyrosine aminotransferase
MGWICCGNAKMMETFLAAKEQIHICGSLLDEELAWRWLRQKEGHLERIQKDIAEKFGIMREWMHTQDDFEWIEPQGGVVCFPRMKKPERINIDGFYDILLHKYGTYAGPGHWFGMPRHYMRLGYGWPTQQELRDGLDAITKSIRETQKST